MKMGFCEIFPGDDVGGITFHIEYIGKKTFSLQEKLKVYNIGPVEIDSANLRYSGPPNVNYIYRE